MKRTLPLLLVALVACAAEEEAALGGADASDATGTLGRTPFGGFDGSMGTVDVDGGGSPDVASVDTVVPPPDAGGGESDTGGAAPDAGPGPDVGGVDAAADAGPALPFTYSWDGSWEPTAADFPMAGLLDDEYFDGHTTWDGTVSTVLPPGSWDWNDATDDYANYRNFEASIGTFEMLVDPWGNHYGWTVVGNTPEAIDFSGAAAYWEGSPGVERLNLGPGGLLHSYTSGNLGDGPDELVFEAAWSLDFRTGSTLTGSLRDNDRVVAGCGEQPDASYPIFSCSIHTGPGTDLVFARDMKGAAVDLGNGDHGRTDTLDPTDGDDVVVLRGNMRDFRVFGGMGDDTFFWFADEGKESIAFFGPNFFGGGGAGEALWGDPGTDRLVFAIPTDTPIVQSFQGPTGKGTLRVWSLADYKSEIWWDAPVDHDPYAKYCITCGFGPAGERTVTFEYISNNDVVHTGYFWVTAVEEIQIGLGPGAKVFALDSKTATLTPLPGAVVAEPPPFPAGVCD
ncbi:MAG: hypothetical protein AMXMBFR64_08460 [Myxococcales bacterium]